MLEVNKERPSDFPTATTCPGSKTSPATAARDTHLCSRVRWLGQLRLSGTIPTLTPSASVLPSHPGKANQCFQEKVDNGTGEEWNLKHSHSLQGLLFFCIFSISFHLSLMQQTQLSGPVDLPQVILPFLYLLILPSPPLPSPPQGKVLIYQIKG